MKLLFGIAILGLMASWTEAEYVPILDLAVDKKDLFMSRGWGASGMPYPMFYLNRYTQTQQMQQKEMDPPKTSQSKQFTLLSGPYQGKSQPDPFDNAKITHRKTNQSRRNHTVPHLFVSYGWGPLG
ncbi:uncharacterized protein LOC129806564 [Phlebotomus papatasi]|uniref:uncharacterized protein LOC129806564 n=1 Tax=Phlebotomus papatasi TaxID=29031 RepID=UPI00248418FD|nr:uncharacterized protein LOC129806564 [Phlebotomus papatasi]